METYKDEPYAWEMRFFLSFQLPGLSGLRRHAEAHPFFASADF
jgi:hypothetical protein